MSDEKEIKEETLSGPKHELKKYLSPFEEMEHMFNDFFQQRFLAPSWMPRLKFPELGGVSTSVDMFEEGNDLVVKAELPGMKKEDINVDLKDDVITISGEKKSEEKTERKDFHRVERTFGSFLRRMRLPVGIKADQVKASFKDGVLEIRMPKSEAAKQNVKKIAVS
jgi:HSP20 family protein